ncbi:thioredoxin family protein [Sulfurimonas sp.]|uniref:thioredoxin family protein n=1 Tax=Sulfurimonas sp. TaxID=2022749 RepID=UPI00262CD3A9|nr:thioredoxin family protein [Sulfurimonas sp.]
MFSAKVVSIFTVIILIITFTIWKLYLQDISQQAKDDIAKGNKVVLLFSAKWCPTCTKEKPIFEKVKKEFPGIHFYDVTTDMNKVQQKLAFRFYKIHGIPTFVMYKNAKEVKRFSGLKSEEELKEYFSSLIN